MNGRPAAERHGHRGKGLTKSPTYRSWAAMRTRISNPKDAEYDRYGGRGVTCCSRWDRFENFLADMGERPKGTSLDRWPDRNGNYEPGNCRWATYQQQSQNCSPQIRTGRYIGAKAKRRGLVIRY